MKKLISLLLCVIIIASFAVPTFAASTTVADLQNELIEVQTKIDKVQNSLEITDNSPDVVLQNLHNNERTMRSTLACSNCGRPMKMFERIYIGEIQCQKTPLSKNKKDKTYVYRYECNSCGTLDEYTNIVCTH